MKTVQTKARESYRFQAKRLQDLLSQLPPDDFEEIIRWPHHKDCQECLNQTGPHDGFCLEGYVNRDKHCKAE